MAESDYVDEFRYEYIKASGAAANDCVVLGYRAPYGIALSAFELESWVIHFKPSGPGGKELGTVYKYGNAVWLTGLWRSPEGPVYVSDSDGVVRIWLDFEQKREEGAAWEEVKLDARLSGLWGLSDDCVFTWGKVGDDDRMFRYDGRTWHPIPSPGHVSVLHGLSPDFVYAVGYGGLMARWDGHAWTPVRLSVESHFTGLFVAGQDEMYATTEDGELWEGTSHGWAKRAESPEPLLDVAKFQGEVWVAGGEEGLLKLKGGTNELECVKPNIEATSFEVRSRLLITTKDIIIHTDDGVKFGGYGRSALRHFRANKPPLWEPD